MTPADAIADVQAALAALEARWGLPLPRRLGWFTWRWPLGEVFAP